MTVKQFEVGIQVFFTYYNLDTYDVLIMAAYVAIMYSKLVKLEFNDPIDILSNDDKFDGSISRQSVIQFFFRVIRSISYASRQTSIS